MKIFFRKLSDDEWWDFREVDTLEQLKTEYKNDLIFTTRIKRYKTFIEEKLKCGIENVDGCITIYDDYLD